MRPPLASYLFLFGFLILLLTACTPSPSATQPQEPTLPPDVIDTATIAPTPTAAAAAATPEPASPTAPAEETLTPTPAPTEAPSPTIPPESSVSPDGRALVEERCSVCHGLGKVQQPRTESEWRNIVDRMIGKGANLTDQEKEVVLQYLITTYAK